MSILPQKRARSLMCINQITLLKSAVGNLLASVNIMKKDLEIYHVEIGFSM